MIHLIPKEQCLANIEYFTKGKGKGNPNYTCLATARKHLQHHEHMDKFRKCKTPEEFYEAAEYCVKHKLVTVTDVCASIVEQL